MDNLTSMVGINLKAVLWGNVQALMVQNWGRVNLNRLAREAKFGAATAMRLKEQKTSVGLDVLEAIGKLFKVDPHELVMPPKVLELHRTFKSKDFLALCDAYNETDATGREFLLMNAQTLIQKARRDKPKAGEA